MSLKHSVLVVANATATSEELVATLKTRATGEQPSFTLVVPATRGRAAARARLAEALEHLREHGIEVDGNVGDPDPIVAIIDAWDPRRHDEIIISTLPANLSKWLQAGLPHRI